MTLVPASLLFLSTPAEAGQTEPQVQRLSKMVQRKLAEAMPLARARLEQYPACRRLFTELGDDGLARLEHTRYTSTTLIQDQRFCGARVSAFTGVGHNVTWLCRSFARLGQKQAATVLIHEALHFAGLTEWPADPQAAGAAEINRRVEKSCQL